MPRGKGNGLGHGGPASGIPAGGNGWGGPPKGTPATGGSRKQFQAGQTPTARPDAAQRRAMRTERVEKLEDELYRLATEADNDVTRVNAAAKLHAIYEGTPVARTITATVDDIGSLSDADLRDELARLGRARAEVEAGNLPTGLPSASGDVVH